jgi:two-component system response regulator CpxR
MGVMWRLLLVEDDLNMADLISQWLSGEGFVVTHCVRGDEVLGLVQNQVFDVVVLDVMLPGLGGFDVLRSLRSEGGALARLPIVMLTARGEVTDRVVGLELGADDYLAKPFDPRELTARLRAVLRRQSEPIGEAEPRASGEKISVDDMEVEVEARVARQAGQTLPLTGAEFDVLLVLVRSAGTVLSRETLCREAFDRKWMSYDRAIDMHVSNLRKKLGPLPDGRERLQNVRGAGYVYVRASAGR